MECVCKEYKEKIGSWQRKGECDICFLNRLAEEDEVLNSMCSTYQVKGTKNDRQRSNECFTEID